MSFGSLLRQTVTLEAKTGINYSGDPTYDPPVTHKARVEGTSKRVLTGINEEKPATAFIIIETVVETGDRITLPTGEKRVVLSVDTIPVGSGRHHHSEVYV